MIEVDHTGQPSEYGFRPSLHHDVAITLSIEDFQGILSSRDPHEIQEAIWCWMVQWFQCLETLLFEKILLICWIAAQKHSTLHMGLGPPIWPSDSRIPAQESWACVTLLQCAGGRNKAPWWSESSQSQLLDRDFSVLSQESCCVFLYFTSMRSYEYFLFPHPSATSWKSNSPQLLIGWLWALHNSSTF